MLFTKRNENRAWSQVTEGLACEPHTYIFPVFASEIRLLFAGYRGARRLQNLTLFATSLPCLRKEISCECMEQHFPCLRLWRSKPSGYFFGKLSKLSRVLFDANLFFLLVVHVHLKLENKCQWIIKLVIFDSKALFKSFPVFNVLETCRVYLFTIDPGIFSCIKKNYQTVFWIMRNL